MSSLAPAATREAAELLSSVQVAPSILSADYARLGEQVQEVLDAGARIIHCDVMDGHFVPPITFGPVVVAALSERLRAAGAIADVHLMVERPERQIEAFASAGADVITVHCEATPHVHRALGAIREAGCLAGVAINPGTPVEQLLALREMADLVLCMSVNPGWGGQRFIETTPAKLSRVRELLAGGCPIEVDGGIDVGTAFGCVRRGASVLVAGSAIFARDSPGEAFRSLVRSAAA